VDLADGRVQAGLDMIGDLNNHNDPKTINLPTASTAAKVLSDAGINLWDVKSIKLRSIEYLYVGGSRTDASVRTGTISVQRQGGVQATLVSGFNAAAGVGNAATTWTAEVPVAAGVTEINNLLADILAELQGGAAANEIITYTVIGQYTPATLTNFKYAIRATLSIVGKIHVTVPS
jgi:hypothetical protein